MLFGTWKHLYGIASILFTLLALKRKDSTFLFLGSKCLKVFSLLAFHRMQMGACRPGVGGPAPLFPGHGMPSQETLLQGGPGGTWWGRRAGPIREQPGPSGLGGRVSGGLTHGPSLGLKEARSAQSPPCLQPQAGSGGLGG